MKKFILILSLFFLHQNIVFSENNSLITEKIHQEYISDLDTALDLSKHNNKKILLIFSASWCQFCENLKNDLSSLDNIDDKIICIVDIEQDKKMARKFKIKTLPSSFLVEGNGNITTSITGYDFNTYNKWLNKWTN